MTNFIDKQAAQAWACDVLAQPPGTVLILDTETCDLNGEIIELAIIDIDGNALYNGRFSPLTEIQPGAQRVHGITREMLEGQPFFADEHPAIRDLLGAAQLVLAYNAPFDVGCLRETCRLHQVAHVSLAHDCIMRWYAKWYGERNGNGYKWQKLAGGDHSALGDARAALALVRKMAEEIDG